MGEGEKERDRRWHGMAPKKEKGAGTEAKRLASFIGSKRKEK